MDRTIQSDEYFFHQAKKCLEMYSKCCERYMLIADFNAEPCLSQFLFEMNAKNIVKEPTCIKVLLTQVVLICYYQ